MILSVAANTPSLLPGGAPPLRVELGADLTLTSDLSATLSLADFLTLELNSVKAGILTLDAAVSLMMARLVAEGVSIADSVAVMTIFNALISETLTLADAVSFLQTATATGIVSLSGTVTLVGGTTATAPPALPYQVWLVELNVPAEA